MLHAISLLLLVLGLAAGGAEENGQKHRRRGRVREQQPLVPQLLPNYTEPSLPPPHEVGCGQATLACAYRGGCGLALKQYMLTCADLVHGQTDKCSRDCKHALIALISTPEGERLMQCSCDDESCVAQKTRVEPCRSEVTWNTRADTVVSCSAATWICAADPLCSTALDYYNRFCKSMFKGRKCSKRCKNSLSILLRQESAAKLATCYCDGSEEFDCTAIRQNTDALCFGKGKSSADKNETITNEVEGASAGARKSVGLSTVLAVVSLTLTCLMSSLGDSVKSLMDPKKSP